MYEKDAGLKDWSKYIWNVFSRSKGVKKTVQKTLESPSVRSSTRKLMGETLEGGLKRIDKKTIQDVGKQLGVGFESKIGPALKTLGEKEAPNIFGRVLGQAKRKAKDVTTETVRRITGAAAIGAMTGAAVAPSNKRSEGAVHGAVGGIIGGATGAAWGKSLLPAVGGAMLGGATAGGLLHRKGKEPEMIGFKYAGVVFDWYDDQGETLKTKFPKLENVPEVIKTASVMAKEKIANEQFALVMIDKGHVFRKYACSDPGTTAMSTIYFMEHGDKLPEGAKKLAAANLVDACLKHGILPPAAMTKEAANSDGNAVNVTGEFPKPIIKQAQSKNDDDYALVLSDGTRKYPIHTWDLVKKASDYFHENKIRMHPEHRRQYAVKLARKSFIMGYPLDGDVVDLGADNYNSSGHLKAAVEMRKVACDPTGPGREFLDGLFEKHAEMHPEVYAEVLRRFDVEEGLDRGWDQVVLDPWTSTFGVKTASVVWEQGAERVTDDALVNIAENHIPRLQMEWADSFADEFRKDPISIFKSLPDPQKKLLARFASDMEASGGSEHGPVEQRRANG